MGVRLNKVLTELNIGLQTAIDYLKNKPSLGEIKDDANVNSKISDEQYNALVREFKGDKDVKTQAGMIFPKKKDKPKKEVKPEPVVEVREESRQTFTPLGKIDLDAIGRPAKRRRNPSRSQS
jgi:translation initiation factor IF-2